MSENRREMLERFSKHFETLSDVSQSYLLGIAEGLDMYHCQTKLKENLTTNSSTPKNPLAIRRKKLQAEKNAAAQ